MSKIISTLKLIEMFVNETEKENQETIKFAKKHGFGAITIDFNLKDFIEWATEEGYNE